MATLTRLAIINAFAQLAGEKTVDKITVKEITDLCGISRNTFYYHFKDVYDVLEQFMEYQSQKVIQMMDELECSSSPEEAYLKRMEVLVGHKSLFANLYQSASRQEVRRYMDQSGLAASRYIVDKMSEGMNVKEEDKVLLSGLFNSAILGLVGSWLDGNIPDSMLEMGKRVHELIGGTLEEALRRSAASNDSSK